MSRDRKKRVDPKKNPKRSLGFFGSSLIGNQAGMSLMLSLSPNHQIAAVVKCQNVTRVKVMYLILSRDALRTLAVAY